MPQLIEKIAIPTFVLDRDGIIVHWNKALAKLTGLSRDSMVGTRNQWRPFYKESRPTLADLILGGTPAENFDRYYRGKYQPCDVLDGAFAAEDFFPEVGKSGEWLSFTASPVHDHLGNVIGAIETLLNISERKKAELELIKREELYRELSITDELTQLFNNRHFSHELKREITRSSRSKQSLALCIFDLDHFKVLNDTHGHPFGNQVLTSFGALIKKHLRSSDVAFRFGGEEFVVLMPDLSDPGAPVERIRASLEALRFSTDEGTEVCITVSAGIACFVDGDDEDSLLKRADQALYQAKHAGRNRTFCIPSHTNSDNTCRNTNCLIDNSNQAGHLKER